MRRFYKRYGRNIAVIYGIDRFNDHTPKERRSTVLYVFDQDDGDAAERGKLVVRVSWPGSAVMPSGRQAVRANQIVSAGRVQRFNLTGAEFELVAESLN